MIVILSTDISKYIISASLTLEKNGVSRSYQIPRKDESINLANVKAIELGLSHLIQPVELKIKTDSAYILASMNSLSKWQQNGFVNSKGIEVKYAQEWRRIADSMKGHTYVEH